MRWAQEAAAEVGHSVGLVFVVFCWDIHTLGMWPFLAAYSERSEAEAFRLFLTVSPSVTVERTKVLNARRGGGGVSLPANTREERREGASAMATTVSQLASKGTSGPEKLPLLGSSGGCAQQGERPNFRRTRRFLLCDF